MVGSRFLDFQIADVSTRCGLRYLLGLSFHLRADDTQLDVGLIQKTAEFIRGIDRPMGIVAESIDRDRNASAIALTHRLTNDLSPELAVAWPCHPLGSPARFGIGSKSDGHS